MTIELLKLTGMLGFDAFMTDLEFIYDLGFIRGAGMMSELFTAMMWRFGIGVANERSLSMILTYYYL